MEDLRIYSFLLIGLTSFPALSFLTSLYSQELFGYSALISVVRLLLVAVGGLAVNIAECVSSTVQLFQLIAGQFLRRISNQILMGAGFTIRFLLVIVQRFRVSCWAFTFLTLAIVAIGTEMKRNIVNLDKSSPIFLSYCSFGTFRM